MKFAFFSHVPWPEGTEPQQLIEEITEQVQYAEELGFVSAWLAEHHFTRYSMVPSSLILATHIASRTTKIRVGTAVLVSPLHNPMRLAEDGAMLDLISNGRLDVGFGRGSGGYEYTGYGLNPAESAGRFQDSIKNNPGPVDHSRLQLRESLQQTGGHQPGPPALAEAPPAHLHRGHPHPGHAGLPGELRP